VKALSILQPWAWLIVRPDLADPRARLTPLLKDVENRTWPTNRRGPFLIHAGKTYSRRRHDEYSVAIRDMFGITLPAYESMPRGGIVGRAFLADCRRDSASRWAAADSWHFVLRHAKPLPFVPWRGQLSFFDVPDKAILSAIEPKGGLL